MTRRAPVVCLEGPSAAGKTTLARALAAGYGAAVVPELVAADAPPPAEAEPYFADRHAEQWGKARALTASAPFVVLDCDVLKGLWFNWMHAGQGWPGADVVAPLYRDRIRRGLLGAPDLYVYLDASEAQLRARKAGDATRSRRGFELHVSRMAAQRAYFAALEGAAPGRVVFLDTADQASLAPRVAALASVLPAPAPDALSVVDAMAAWVARHRPDQFG